jgi:hypothetical protein
MTETLIMTHIVSTMKDAQQLFDNGISKKDFVMRQLKTILGDATYSRYEPLISLTIDFIKSIARNETLLKEFKKTKCYTMFNCLPKT